MGFTLNKRFISFKDLTVICEIIRLVFTRVAICCAQTRTSFKKQQQLPRHISIPDVLNMQGQVARCYAETCFQKFVGDNLQRLRELSEADLINEFAGLKLNLRQGFVFTGMGDLQSKLLTVTEAKKRKADTVLQSRKQQRLLQAEQPTFVECIA